MSTFTGVTHEFAVAARIAAIPAFVTWLIDSGGLPDYTDIAVAASTADGFEEKIIKMMVSDNVDGTKRPGNVVALKKFWIACHDQYELDRKPRSEDTSLADDPIPKVQEKIIVGLWANRHKFELPGSQLLIPSLVGRMWRDYNSTPPQISVLLPEQLRPRSCITKAVGTNLAVTPGQLVKALAVVIDEVEKSFELFLRIRAWLMTLAFVSVTDPNWFPLQVAILASDQIMGAISNTDRGRVPPVLFLVEAWAHTVHHFAETMRMQKHRTAGDIIGSLNQWDHFWKYSSAADSSSSIAPALGAAPDNHDLRNQLDAMNGNIKHWRAEASKLKDEVKALRGGGNRDQDNDEPRRKQGGGQHQQQGPPRKIQKGGGKGGKPSNFSQKRGGRR